MKFAVHNKQYLEKLNASQCQTMKKWQENVGKQMNKNNKHAYQNNTPMQINNSWVLSKFQLIGLIEISLRVCSNNDR